jgi:1-acyl-sn-glycerol-3-phosphate acyltransferase
MSTAPIRLPNPHLYAIVRAVARALLWLLTRTEIRGLEHVPARGPYIILTNHLSAIDPPLIMAVFPSPITVFAGHTHRHEFIIGEVMNALGAIWVKRGEVDRHALRAALDALKAGGILGLAPEGTRSRTGGLLKGKIGAAYLASRVDVPLIPAALTGTEVGLLVLLKLGRPRTTVTIGPPFRLPNANPQASRQELEEYTELMMRTLAGMLPEQYRGEYRD